MDKVDKVIEAANTYYNKTHNRKEENIIGRFRSWEHCYKCFYDARKNPSPDYDYLSLQLAFYLASWGMYRGSSFLLQEDYKVHIPVVKQLLKPQYNCLLDIKCAELQKSEVCWKALEELKTFMTKYYDRIRKSVKGAEVQKEVSDTLITKILMGTLGCVPAYDRFFIDGIKKLDVTTGDFNKESLDNLVNFYEENNMRFEETRKRFKAHGLQYPQMKLLDMAFWQIGFEHSD
jgi:hypothetical protein